MRDTLLKRLILFVACWVGIDLLAQLIGASYAGGQAASGIADPDTAFRIGSAAASKFSASYGMLIHMGALLLAAIAAFPWQWAILAAIAGGLVYFGFGDRLGQEPKHETEATEPAAPAKKELAPVAPPAAPAAPAAAGLAPGKIVRLTKSVTVQLAYGSAVIPVGTRAMLLGANGETFRLKTEAGQEFIAPRSHFEPEWKGE